MVNRVALDVNGLRVSKPGFDVATTGEANLSLNSNPMYGVYLTGTVYVASNTSVNVPFLTTFSNHPIVVIQDVKSSVYSRFGFDINGGGSGDLPLQLTWTTSSLTITTKPIYPSTTFRYSIFFNEV